MRDNAGFVLAVVAFVALIIFSITYYVHQSQDCDAKGGTLVRKANGFYACFDKEIK